MYRSRPVTADLDYTPNLADRANADTIVNSTATRRVGVLVLGMHRSGTSALTRVLNLLGCTLPRTLLGGDQANSEGHWESEPICRFNDELLALAGSKWDDWAPVGSGFFVAPGYRELVARGASLLREEFAEAPLFVLKDPRNCRLARFWIDIFADQGIGLAIVLPIRNPLAVARSLKARNNADEHYATLLWLRHVLEAEAATRGRTRVFTSYDQMTDSWELVTGRLQQALGISWPRMSPATQEEIGRFIDKRHRHETASPEALINDPTVSTWLRRTWSILQNWALHSENPEDYAELDAILRGFNDASPAFARLVLRGSEAQLRANELERELAEAQARQTDIAVQAAQQLHAEQETLVRELREATERLAEYDSRLAEQESALVQRREENEQAWAALSAEIATTTDLRSQIADLTAREETQRQRLAESEAWVFRLAGERRVAELQSARAATAHAQLIKAAAANAARLGELARIQAQLAKRNNQVTTLSKLLDQVQLQAAAAEAGGDSRHEWAEKYEEMEARLRSLLSEQAELRAIAAGSVAANSNEWAKRTGELEARQNILLAEQAASEVRLKDRFKEIALLTSMVREQEQEALRKERQVEWLRQVSAASLTRPWWWALMPKNWRGQREARRFKARGLFDADAYRAQHVDVSESGMDPLRHYLLHGHAEGRRPTSALLHPEDAGQ